MHGHRHRSRTASLGHNPIGRSLHTTHLFYLFSLEVLGLGLWRRKLHQNSRPVWRSCSIMERPSKCSSGAADTKTGVASTKCCEDVAGSSASRTTLGALSGGERTRALLRSLLLRRPDIIVLGEPKHELDIEDRPIPFSHCRRPNGGRRGERRLSWSTWPGRRAWAVMP
jgi:hypothetical protein